MKKLYTLVALMFVATSIFAQLNESFEGTTFPPVGWKSLDVDGDGMNWGAYTVTSSNIAHTGTYTAASASWDSQTELALTPNNWLITPGLKVTSATDSVTFWIAPQDKKWPGEHIDVKLSTTGINQADFTTTLYSKTFTFADTLVDWHYVAKSLSSYVGDTVYVAFIHSNCTDMFMLKLDDVKGPATYISGNDLSVLALSVPTGIVRSGNINLKAYLKNEGGASIAAGKTITFYSGTTQIGTAATTAAIASGAIDSVSFTWNNVQPGIYALKAQSPSDDYNANNIATDSLEVFPADILIESFEDIAALPPTNWTSTEAWALGTNPVNAFKGTQYAYCPASTPSAKLITPKLICANGDSLTFMAYSLATASNPTIKIQYSTDKATWTDLPGASYIMTGSYTYYKASINLTGQYYFSFTCINNSTASARMDWVVGPKLAPVGIEESTTSKILVFPTIANNQVTIKGTETIETLSVYNMLGQVVLSMNVNSNETSINVANLVNGEYVVIANANNQLLKGKIIVKH